MKRFNVKYVLTISVLLLVGCGKELNAELSAHRAWVSTCKNETIRYQTAEKPNEFMIFTATCQRDNNEP